MNILESMLNEKDMRSEQFLDVRKNNELDEEISVEKDNVALDRTIDGISETLKKNIEKEVEKINVESPIWEKISKGSFSKTIKTAIEATLKAFLKKKFNINFSTFNDMKTAWNAAMDGNLKEALKKTSDVAVDGIVVLPSTVKTVIKTVKNTVIDKTVDSQKYEVMNRQTKVINRISSNCQKFGEALKINDAKNIKKTAEAIKKDMNTILPIRETISMAQNVLDKYSLWQNKGNEQLTKDENDLINKLNNCA